MSAISSESEKSERAPLPQGTILGFGSLTAGGIRMLTQRAVLPHLHRLLASSTGGAATDCQLLEEFLARRDPAAFASLMRRHGGTVLGVCQRVLNHVHDAEDAFQATFLVLIRKARSIAKREAVGSW